MDPIKQATRSTEISTKVAQLFKRRVELAQEHYRDRMAQAWRDSVAGLAATPQTPWDWWVQGCNYAVDATQRSILFWDTLRQRGNNYVEHKRKGQPPVLHFDYEMVVDGRKFARPVNYALVRIVPPEGRDGRPEAAPVRHHRPARRPRPRHRRLQGRFAGRRRAARRPSGLLRDLLPRAGAGADAARRCEAEQRVRAQGARAASGQPQAGDRRQLPGRLGGDDAGRLGPRRHRPDRDQRRADVVLGRRVRRGRGRQPDALRRRHAGRHLARVVHRRPGRRHLRRRVPGRELREPEPGEHVLGQVLPPVRQRRHRAAALPRVRALVGRVLPDEPRGDRVDHAQPLRRQQAVDRRRGGGAGQVLRPARRSSRRSSCSRRWATTSRRRSRRSTGSPTSTARPTRSRRAAR